MKISPMLARNMREALHAMEATERKLNETEAAIDAVEAEIAADGGIGGLKARMDRMEPVVWEKHKVELPEFAE